ncbi:MAPEG family protein [Chitinimonas sp. BJYL2]|uniref:MAPEG family protein n=1 Tax=Chitinimonas sp. BJYL2 TaxID=2976696 RepID=UPI0022B31FAC|nr:MAPEG family protein [Chitinimonas sp. BJYL2]
MAIAYASMLIVALLPFIWIYFAKFGGKHEDGTPRRYNNYAPRAQQAKLEGFAARALWAHNNAFESAPAFFAAVLVAVQAGVPADQINTAALVFVMARVLHGVLYLANLAWQRSLAWVVGLLAVVYLFVQAISRVA